MADVVQGMLQNALGDAARSTKYEAYINFNTPALGPGNTEVYMHVKTAMFPGKSHEPYDLKYKGRSIPVRGQVKYDNTWTCTFYLTEGHELKIAFEDWIESLDQTQNMSNALSSSVQAGQSQGTNFASEFMIAQMDFTGNSQTSVYTLHNIFPKSVSSVQVDYSSVGTISEFTVEFSYTHYTSVRVGGFKLPAKSGGGPDIPGFDKLGFDNPNLVIPGAGFNREALNDLQSQLLNSGNAALKDSINSITAGDFGNVGNIATNFGGDAFGSVLSTFGIAKSQRRLESIKDIPRDIKSTLSNNSSGLLSRIRSFI